MNSFFIKTGRTEGTGRIYEATYCGFVGQFKAVEVDGTDGERCEIGPDIYRPTIDSLRNHLNDIDRGE